MANNAQIPLPDTIGPHLETPSSYALCLSDTPMLLEHPYLPMETGVALGEDKLYHIAAQTYMPSVTGAMIDWWIGFLPSNPTLSSEIYKLWHPRDHVFSSWYGPRNNDSTYVGGHHLVHEFIGGHLGKLAISFVSPSVRFGPNWESDFKKANVATAICARVGNWVNSDTWKEGDKPEVKYTGHLVHLCMQEADGIRMRSRFWLGDVDGMPEGEGVKMVPGFMLEGLMKHCSEEMAILAQILPSLYERWS